MHEKDRPSIPTGWWLNGMCGLYLVLVEPWVWEFAGGGFETAQPAPAIGIVIAVVAAVEFIALPLKMRLTCARRSTPTTTIVHIGVLLNAVTWVYVYFAACIALGIGPAASPVQFAVPLLVTLRLLVTLGVSAPRAHDAPPVAPSSRLELACDLALGCYLCVVETILIGLWRLTSPSESSLGLALQLGCVALGFAITFFPTRLPYLIEEWDAVRDGERSRLALALSVALVFVPLFLGGADLTLPTLLVLLLG